MSAKAETRPTTDPAGLIQAWDGDRGHGAQEREQGPN